MIESAQNIVVLLAIQSTSHSADHIFRRFKGQTSKIDIEESLLPKDLMAHSASVTIPSDPEILGQLFEEAANADGQESLSAIWNRKLSALALPLTSTTLLPFLKTGAADFAAGVHANVLAYLRKHPSGVRSVSEDDESDEVVDDDDGPKAPKAVKVPAPKPVKAPAAKAAPGGGRDALVAEIATKMAANVGKFYNLATGRMVTNSAANAKKLTFETYDGLAIASDSTSELSNSRRELLVSGVSSGPVAPSAKKSARPSTASVPSVVSAASSEKTPAEALVALIRSRLSTTKREGGYFNTATKAIITDTDQNRKKGLVYRVYGDLRVAGVPGTPAFDEAIAYIVEATGEGGEEESAARPAAKASRPAVPAPPVGKPPTTKPVSSAAKPVSTAAKPPPETLDVKIAGSNDKNPDGYFNLATNKSVKKTDANLKKFTFADVAIEGGRVLRLAAENFELLQSSIAGFHDEAEPVSEPIYSGKDAPVAAAEEHRIVQNDDGIWTDGKFAFTSDADDARVMGKFENGKVVPLTEEDRQEALSLGLQVEATEDEDAEEDEEEDIPEAVDESVKAATLQMPVTDDQIRAYVRLSKAQTHAMDSKEARDVIGITEEQMIYLIRNLASLRRSKPALFK